MQTAFVTGGSRGVGRGIATTLSEEGFRVFATGRSIAAADLPDGIERIPCDHLDPDQTRAAFAQAGPVDLLVNNAWGGYERMVEDGNFTWGLPFWQQPAHRWTAMMEVGVRAAWECSSAVAPGMVERGRGLIVNIGFWAAQKYIGNALYGVAKAAIDKLTADMAQELRSHGVAVVSLYPGMVRTEAVMDAAAGGWLDISNSESPEFLGHVIAALSRDPMLMERSGKVSVAAQLALAYGIQDVDGTQPRPLTIETV